MEPAGTQGINFFLTFMNVGKISFTVFPVIVKYNIISFIASGAVAKGPFTVTTVAVMAGCLALVALVLVAAIVIVLYRRRAPHSKSPTLLVQEE